ncbi:uncharacterized protein LOC119727901 [Patiria miniata]|uniref:Uncharacterized protein n=1 Tax=Patiria miniata TaxID=46514 RepID=A0A913ZWK6_PATMI|nr:uncharacterized protein LOC119727901 [Patiria miniata]
MESPADFYRHVLTEVLDDLMDQVGGLTKIEKVKKALRKISQMYKGGLSNASSQCRSDWSDPANRCAYVFLYLMQHCHLVFSSLQYTSKILNSWQNKSNLKICSIGGGPGSDLVGLTTFLRKKGIFPPLLECLVLDLYPNWKDTWDMIYKRIPERFGVQYKRCDIVRDTALTSISTRRFIRDADMLTMVKFFSTVSAFFRDEPGCGDLLRSFLHELKPGCFVLFIDNQHNSDTQFEQDFASPIGLGKVFEFRGKSTLPFGQYSSTVKRYCRDLNYKPMSSCEVLIQLYKKLAVQPASRSCVISQDRNNRIPLQHSGSSVDRIQPGAHHRNNVDDRLSSSSQPRYSSLPAASSRSLVLHDFANRRHVPTSPVDGDSDSSYDNSDDDNSYEYDSDDRDYDYDDYDSNDCYDGYGDYDCDDDYDSDDNRNDCYDGHDDYDNDDYDSYRYDCYEEYDYMYDKYYGFDDKKDRYDGCHEYDCDDSYNDYDDYDRNKRL